MEGGDISNTIVSGRTLVHARTFTLPRYEINTAMLGLIRTVHRYHDINLVDLSRIVRACQSLPRPILVTTDGDEEYCEELYGHLNSGYEHPFRDWACYETDQGLAMLMAWMPNTRIIDIPGKAGVFGVRYLDIPW